MGDRTIESNTHLGITGLEVVCDGNDTFLMPVNSRGGNRVCLSEFQGDLIPQSELKTLLTCFFPTTIIASQDVS
jgi:hypothetical protein